MNSQAKLFGWGISSNSIDPLVICWEKTIGSNKHIEVESMLKWTSAIPPTDVEEEIQISTLRRLDIPWLLTGIKSATTISSFHPNFSKKNRNSTKQKAVSKFEVSTALLQNTQQVFNFTCLSRCWIAVWAAAKPPSRQIRHVAVQASVHKSRWPVWPMIALKGDKTTWKDWLVLGGCLFLGMTSRQKKYQPPRRPRRTEKVPIRLTSITTHRDHQAKVKVIIQTDNQIITY